MRKQQSAPFFFEAGPRAVLLLHGFTGSSADVRMLGRFLEKNGYTSYAPHYKGHGVPPEQLIQSAPDEWWTDVLAAYNMLKEAGYEEIAVAGLSLGGVFSLKLALHVPIKGIITMCAPMTMRTTDIMFEGVLQYAKQYKIQEGKSEQEIEIETLITRPIEQAIAAVSGVEEISSSSSEGKSSVRISFAWGTNLDAATNDVRDRIDRIIKRLPDDGGFAGA